MSNWSSSSTNTKKGISINNNVLNKIKTSLFPNLKINLKNLNSGKNGKVFSILQNENKVLKVSELNGKNGKKEATFSMMASNAEIGPKIFKTFVIQNHLAILQERMHGTLEEYMWNNVFTDENFRQIENLVMQLHKVGICHKDLHVKNIMYKMHNKKPIFKIIDFSRATVKNGLCDSNRNKVNVLQRRVSHGSTNNSSTHYSQKNLKLNFNSANFITP